MTGKIQNIEKTDINGKITFNGEIGNKKFFASYSRKPYFIHIERKDSIKKPLSKEEKNKICSHLKEKFEIKSKD